MQRTAYKIQPLNLSDPVVLYRILMRPLLSSKREYKIKIKDPGHEFLANSK
jgi:hypothetical protein